jgi:hypothetical protein
LSATLLVFFVLVASALCCWFFCFGGIRFLLLVFHALPLCGAAVTFFAAAKKVTKESGFNLRCLPG